uniref:Uncharacterized protein n=1 Tax=Manihot esculenta TaxID=3983 RepID=A0A2C9VQY8_MANES
MDYSKLAELLHKNQKRHLQCQAFWVLNNLCKGLKEGSQVSTIDNSVVSCYIHLHFILHTKESICISHYSWFRCSNSHYSPLNNILKFKQKRLG